MPYFKDSIKLQKFHGYKIPQSASKAVLGANKGAYFFWNGEWNFTVVDDFYIRALDADVEFNIDGYRGENPIEVLK